MIRAILFAILAALSLSVASCATMQSPCPPTGCPDFPGNG
jgi:hypothetical protein